MKCRSRKWRRECQKLCHPDYLDAIKHAAQLSNQEGLVIYPCALIAGHSHVGHKSRKQIAAAQKQIAAAQMIDSAIPVLWADGVSGSEQTESFPLMHDLKQSKQINPPRLLHDLAWRLARSKRRVAKAEAAIASSTNLRPATYLRRQQSLRDRRSHLAWLKTQYEAPPIQSRQESAAVYFHSDTGNSGACHFQN